MPQASQSNCERCGGQNNVEVLFGRAFCADCLQNAPFADCHRCGAMILDVLLNNGACPDCATHRIRCDECGRRHEDLYLVQGSLLCPRCRGGFTRCQRCDEWTDLESMREYRGSRVCEACHRILTSPGPRDYWPSRDFSPDGSYEEIGSRRTFGVEIETSECPDYRDIRNETVFGAKPDPSISGVEFTSPILCSDAGLEAIRDFVRVAQRLGFAVDSQCGLHIHIGLPGDTAARLRVALAYLLTEETWRSFVPSERRESRYCHPVDYTEQDVLEATSWNDFCDRIEDRYGWVNWLASKEYDTVEIRLHQGTIGDRMILNWIKAHVRFIDWAINCTDFQEIRDALDCDQFVALAKIWADDELVEHYALMREMFHEEVGVLQ